MTFVYQLVIIYQFHRFTFKLAIDNIFVTFYLLWIAKFFFLLPYNSQT